MLRIIFKKRPVFLAAIAFIAMTAWSQADPVYYTMDDVKEGEKEAMDHHIPIVWLASNPESLMEKAPPKKSSGDLTQMSVKYLSADQWRDRVVLVCVNWDKEADLVPAAVVEQFNQYDDGALQDNAYMLYPKLVISNPDGSKTLGRLAATDMQTEREGAIYKKLAAIFSDVNAQATVLGMSVTELKQARAKQNIFNRLGMDPTRAIAILAIVLVVGGVIVTLIMVRRSQQ